VVGNDAKISGIDDEGYWLGSLLATSNEVCLDAMYRI
jgi:hypothetical protein